jgi:hypothetical protein
MFSSQSLFHHLLQLPPLHQPLPGPHSQILYLQFDWKMEWIPYKKKKSRARTPSFVTFTTISSFLSNQPYISSIKAPSSFSRLPQTSLPPSSYYSHTPSPISQFFFPNILNDERVFYKSVCKKFVFFDVHDLTSTYIIYHWVCRGVLRQELQEFKSYKIVSVN